MRWYIREGETNRVIGVLVAPDSLSKEEILDVMDRGGWSYIRPYWDYSQREVYDLLGWDQVTQDNWLQRDVVSAASNGYIWFRGGKRVFLIAYWDEIIRRVLVEPAVFEELDRLACRKGSFRRVREINELLRLLQDQE